MAECSDFVMVQS